MSKKDSAVCTASGDGADATPEFSAGCPLDMSRLLIMDFVSTLEDEATRQGTLDVGSLRAMAEQFLIRLRANTSAPDNCLRLHERMLWDERRRHPFERLIIRRFSRLLPKRAGDEGSPDSAPLSRRAIPGLAVAMTKMIGLDRYRVYEASVRAIIDRHKIDCPGPIDWATLANRPDARAVIDEALLSMAPYFCDLDKRLLWLTEVINSHLGPPQPEDGSSLWLMDANKALQLLGTLYEDLRQTLDQAPHSIETGYGPRAIHNLRTLDLALNKATLRLDEAARRGRDAVSNSSHS